MRRVEDIIADASVASRRLYAQGLAEGMLVTLRLVVGDPVDGGTPMPGELTAEQEAWARDAIARLEEGTS